MIIAFLFSVEPHYTHCVCVCVQKSIGIITNNNDSTCKIIWFSIFSPLIGKLIVKLLAESNLTEENAKEISRNTQNTMIVFFVSLFHTNLKLNRGLSIKCERCQTRCKLQIIVFRHDICRQSFELAFHLFVFTLNNWIRFRIGFG